ncbi:MAG: S8 family serine peptidase [Vulcanimicrobiota bacterium]
MITTCLLCQQAPPATLEPGVFPITNFNQVAMQTQQQAMQARLDALGVQRGKPEQTQPGTLYVADSYVPCITSPEPAHGLEVQSAARSTGYQGPIQLRDFSSQHYVVYDPRDPQPGQDLRASDYLRNLSWQTQERFQQVLRPATQQLNELTEGGVKNSVLNISMGTSLGRVVNEAYLQLVQGTADRTGAALAFGLDESKLTHPDPNISGPERNRLQQALIDEVGQTVKDSKSIHQAQEQYQQAVSQFTAGQNSLVVSGGNEGEVAHKLQDGSFGQQLKLPANFLDSPLAQAGVVVVGATEGDHSLKPAAYSQAHRQNGIYASGTVPGQPGEGSSFAAPRVAATLAALHKANPQLSSAEIQALLLNHLTRPSEGSQIPALDLQATAQFLKESQLDNSQDGWLLSH